MKKFIIAIALLTTFTIVNAQAQSLESAKKDLDRALSKTENPRKAKKASTWIKLGKAYIDAYDAPIGKIWLGMSRQEISLILGSDKPLSMENINVQGQNLVKEVYDNKVLYITPEGKLMAIEVTNPIDAMALQNAVGAYTKAYEIDNGEKNDVCEGLKVISQKMTNEAYSRYAIGDMEGACKYFAEAAKTSSTAPLSVIDTNAIYNAGFTASNAGKKDLAVKYFKECYNHKYYAANGEVFSYLAANDTINALKYLEEGFSKFPQSQNILIGLINYYTTKGENPDRLFSLLDQAKKNEPNNASLYYVEGNIRAKLGQIDKAVEAYEKCAGIDPNYEYGFIGEGVMFYNRALEIQKEAQNEMDDAKYAKLNEEFEKTLKSCLDPFEKAYSITKSDQIKVSIAEYLKNAYFRFREQDPKFKTAFEKYDKIVSSGKVE